MSGLHPPSEMRDLAAEADRLAALARYGVLATPPERGFDDIAFLATQLCAAPIAMVSFVSADRQWAKARIGFEPDGMPLASSICVHALSSGPHDLLVIPDLTQDPRTRANPLVTGPESWRFYAGAPLVAPDGKVLGTLCVLDTTPRPEALSSAQRSGLAALVRQVMAQLELRRALDAREPASDGSGALRESEMRLRLAVEATGVGIFDYDPVGGTLVWDQRTRALFGIGPDDPISYETTFLPGVHPDDRERADRAVRASLDPEGSRLFAYEYRTIDREGRVLHWLEARGRLTVEDGRAHRLVGTVRDVTAEREAQAETLATQARYDLVTRATNDAIWDWDLVTDHVLWNEGLAAAYGWVGEAVEPTGGWWLERVHPADRARVEADIRSVIDGTAQDWRHEYRFRRADGSFADVFDRGYMVRDAAGAPLRMIAAMLDLTQRNRAEAQLRAVFEGANVGIVQLDPRDLRALRVNAKLCTIWGADEADIVGQSIARWTPEDDGAERDRLHRRLQAGEIIRETLEKRYRRKDGRLIWARVNIVSQPLADELQITAMIEDITPEKTAEARQRALIELGDRLRDADTAGAVSETAADILGRTLGLARAGYAAIDSEAGTFTVDRDWTNEAESLTETYPLSSFAATIARLRRGRVLAVADVTADPDLCADAASYARIRTRAQIKVPLIRRGELLGVLYAHEAAPRAWSQSEIEFAQEVAERAWAALGRLQSEEQQRILNRELSHRLKNTLAMVQAIVSQTLRNVADVEEAKDALVARLIALGQAHDILLSGESESADIRAVIAGALAIHDDREPDRFRLDGPPILVGPKAALALALMMHELATNAAKYGALSMPGGRVSVAWALEGAGDDPSVSLCWSESGGPRVALPAKKGFGSRLIERGLAGAIGGQTVLAYEPDGVVCRVAASLSGFLARD